MADLYGMDPARIERLRSSNWTRRLGGRVFFRPIGKMAKIWDALDPDPSVTPVNIGSGVGFAPCIVRDGEVIAFARRYPQATAVGCDILEGMVALLKDAIWHQKKASILSRMSAATNAWKCAGIGC